MRALIISIMVALSTACAMTANDSNRVDLTQPDQHAPLPDKIYFIGQDLDSLRGYFQSNCCMMADGTTAYLSLYRLLDGDDKGGLGFDENGNVLAPEREWGAGRVGAYQSATEFGPSHLAIGLFIAENDLENGLTRIVDGEFDDEIRHLSKFIKSVKGQVFLRIGYEFDGVWNQGQENPEKYKNAYTHIADLLRVENTPNVIFVWQAGAAVVDDVIEQKHENIADWYPGDDYVDWVALSWFTRPDFRPEPSEDFIPPTSRELSEEVVEFARLRNKPVMIAEASPQGFDLNKSFRANITPLLDGPSAQNVVELTPEQIWNQWYAPFFEFLDTHSDAIKAIAYINADWDSQAMWGPPYDSGFWGDSRLETNSDIADRFDQAITDWKQN